MANTAQARKRARQAVKQRAHNMSLRSTLRTAIKKVQKAVEAGDKATAQEVYRSSVSVIDFAVLLELIRLELLLRCNAQGKSY